MDVLKTKSLARFSRRECITDRSRREAMAEAILEMADGMHRTDLLDDAALAKITLRHPRKPTGIAEPISAEEIRRVRERAHLSQAVFARYLKVTTGYVSQLERAAKRPAGAALALLNLIRRKGIEVVL